MPIKVGDFVDLRRGVTYKGDLVGKPGPALLGLGSITPGGGFRNSDFKTYGGDCPPSIMLGPGDLFVSLKGATKDGEMIGSIARVPITLPAGRLTQDTVKLIFKPEAKGNESYIYWCLRTPQYRAFCAGVARGSAVVALSREDFLSYQLPDRDAGRDLIVALLELTEEKIELNRKMNETLEQLARALFKSWFIDFDPVHAKSVGRQPAGMDKAISDLFPDSFVDSELGKIPKGWEVSGLGQVADVIDCLHAKKPEASEAGQLYLQLNNIRDDGLIDISEAFLIGQEDYKKWTSRMEAAEGDCVITNVGRVGAVAQIPHGMKAALGRNITGIRCKPIFTYPTFLIECLLSEAMREEIRRKTDTGTILDALNVKSIPKLRFIKPPLIIAEKFERVARPLRHQMEKGVSQSRTLSNLRDTLLPKLISGYPTKTSLK